jgi:hypothetical protein
VDDGDVVDLSQFGWAVAELAAGAFPVSVGLGDALERTLSRESEGRLQKLAELDDFWAIHRQPSWGDGVHARELVDDPDLWAPAPVRGDLALRIPGPAASKTCDAWRSLMPSVPVGDRGGPLFVRRHAGDGSDWWPVELAPGASDDSYVLAHTPESDPFLASEEA